MDTPTADRLVLRPTYELAVLPPYATVSELLGNGVEGGYCELLPDRELPASELNAEAVGSKGGRFPPPWWSDDPMIQNAAVHLFRLRDSYYLPEFGVVVSASGEVMHHSLVEASYFTPDLARLPHAERQGDETLLDIPSDVEVLDRVIVSMPWGALSNYGHFLLDCLPTVATAAELAELSDYRFVFPRLTRPWQRPHLELLDVEPVELDGRIYRVSDLIFSSCMASFVYRPNVNYLTLRDRQLARKRPTGLSYEKIYITRRHLPKRGIPSRVFLSEERLEQRLEKLGFAIVAPEQHTVEGQIDIFRNAEIIVGSAGAGFANVLYCREGATVVEITPPSMYQRQLNGMWVCNICVIVGCKWRPYYCAEIPPLSPVVIGGVERSEHGFTFDVDMDDLLAYLDALSD